jgi:hypothetical protein
MRHKLQVFFQQRHKVKFLLSRLLRDFKLLDHFKSLLPTKQLYCA